MEQTENIINEEIVTGLEFEEEECTLTLEDLEKMLSEPVIEISLDSCEGQKIDNKEFAKGVKDASYYVGFISALQQINVPIGQILEVLITKENILINREANINRLSIAEKTDILRL